MYFKQSRILLLSCLVVCSCFYCVAGCNAPTETSAVESPTPVQATRTPAPLTPTPQPVAVEVNGEGILLSEYEAELQRLISAQSELGIESTPEEQQKKVLDDLIDQVLLAQAASEAGYVISEEDLQARLDQLEVKLGENQSIENWQNQYGYNDENFHCALKRSLAAAWQRDQITDSVPDTIEQVHARQIMVQDADLADQIYQQLETGANFATLALRYDPETGGELGWFPKGYLIRLEVEEAVFALQPGQYSPVIESAIGCHIVQLIAREDQRMLLPDAKRILKHKALKKWLEERRNESDITTLIS